MNRDDAIKAVDEAFNDGVKHLYETFVTLLETKQLPLDQMSEHFRSGLAYHCDAHAKTTALVIDYFQGFKGEHA
jgi:exonuclease VII small subunit